MLQDGRLHLSGIAKLARVLTEANREALLDRAKHKTKRKIEELVAEVVPKPDVPSTIRKLPVPREPSKAATVVELRPGTADTSTSPASHKAPVKPTVVEPLAPSRYRVQFTAGAELHEKLERLSSLMPGVDLASIIEVAVTEKLERVEAKRFGQTNKPRKSLEEADTSPGSRYISAPVKRFVWKRDGGRCTDLSRTDDAAPHEKDSSITTTIRTVSAVIERLRMSGCYVASTTLSGLSVISART